MLDEGKIPAEGMASQDRRRTAMELGMPVTLTPLGAAYDPPWSQVTSASVVAFTANGHIALADLNRGLDLPGGHVQQHDRSPQDTARREAWEETRILLHALTRIEVIQSDYFGPDDLTFMVIYAARIRKIVPWVAGDDESRGRQLLTPADFLAQYTAGDPALMTHLVTTAQTHNDTAADSTC